MFSADGTSITNYGLLNSEANGDTFGIEVTDGLLHAAGDTRGLNTIVCGGTDLWFFDEAAAMAYASTLTASIPSCAD
ncbi:MAG: hypothetical protein KUG67_01015 [Proteobacteria bacterium]|nr:hypothetical protein [Pseudomonadota bacterium]